MKILSLNIRTWTRDKNKVNSHWWIERYYKIHDYIKEENPDVICLQEVLWPAKYILKLKELGYKRTGWGFTHPVYVRKSKKVQKHRVSIFSTRVIVDEIQYFSVHCRWEEKLFQKAMKWIYKRVVENNNMKCIAAGDFNRSDISSITQAIDMTSARQELELESQDTFTNYKRPEQSHGEIDHFFVSGFWKTLYTIESYKVGPSDLSDHRPIVLTFKKKEDDRIN